LVSVTATRLSPSPGIAHLSERGVPIVDHRNRAIGQHASDRGRRLGGVGGSFL
jgi:hypothetical protein